MNFLEHPTCNNIISARWWNFHLAGLPMIYVHILSVSQYFPVSVRFYIKSISVRLLFNVTTQAAGRLTTESSGKTSKPSSRLFSNSRNPTTFGKLSVVRSKAYSQSLGAISTSLHELSSRNRRLIGSRAVGCRREIDDTRNHYITTIYNRERKLPLRACNRLNCGMKQRLRDS